MLFKGFACAAVGAAIGAAAWAALNQATGMSLWILAPIVGGFAGYGMMRGTQMRGGAPAGALAAAVTIAAIFAARYYNVTHEVSEQLALDDTDMIEMLVWDVAEEWENEGYQVYSEDLEDFVPGVYDEAEERWYAMSEAEQQAYVASFNELNEEIDEAMTPLALLFDFGLFGVVCAALAAGTAFKTGSITLEEALIQRGHASGADEAAGMAATLRAADSGFFARLGESAGQAHGGASRIANAPNAPTSAQMPARRNAA